MNSSSSRAPFSGARSLASSNWRVKSDIVEPSTLPSSTWRSRSDPQPQRQIPSPTWRRKDDPQPYSPSPRRSQPHLKPSSDLDRPYDPDYPSSTRIYVGNLLYSVQPHTITNFFSEAGFVNIDINMAIDPFTGRNPSFCFVDFESMEEARRAIEELDGVEIGGRPVKIRNGVPKKGKNGGDGDGGRGEGRGYRVRNWSGGLEGREGVLWREDGQASPVFDRWARTSEAPDHWFGQASLGKRIYVGGLPRIDNYTALEAEITMLFSGFKVEAISRLISPDPKKKGIPGNHYFVFVDMESEKEADRAVQRMLGMPTWWGGKLKVHKARPGSDSKRVLREQANGGLKEDGKGKVEGEKSWGGGDREGGGDRDWRGGEGNIDGERNWRARQHKYQGEKERIWTNKGRDAAREDGNGKWEGEVKNEVPEGKLIDLD